MLKKLYLKPAWVVAEGPAAEIWANNFHNSNFADSFLWNKNVSAVITGTGWASDLEHRARSEACQLGILTIAVMDHWTNYEMRFFRNGKQVLPDEFWVVDDYAEEKIRYFFPHKSVLSIPDYYAEGELAKLDPINEDTPDVLFI